MILLGDILSTAEDVQYREGCHYDKCGGYGEYRGDTILCNLSIVGDIMSSVGVFSTVGVNNKTFSPTVLMIFPTVLKTSPTRIMMSPTQPRYCTQVIQGENHCRKSLIKIFDDFIANQE